MGFSGGVLHNGQGVRRRVPSGWRGFPFVLALLCTTSCYAAHPLITEDTDTQGRGNGQLELTAEYGHDEAADAKENAADYAAILTWGLRDSLDVLLTVPYARADTLASGGETTVTGLGDIGVDAKWRFFEAQRLRMALKAGGTFASGDAPQGLGAGKPNFSVNYVTSYEADKWAAHLHLEFRRNHNVVGEREVIHHASVALTRMLTDRLKLVADLGRFTSTDRSVGEDSRFLTLGAIYGLRDDFDLDIGLKRGLSDPETDSTLLLGLALRF